MRNQFDTTIEKLNSLIDSLARKPRNKNTRLALTYLKATIGVLKAEQERLNKKLPRTNEFLEGIKRSR